MGARVGDGKAQGADNSRDRVDGEGATTSAFILHSTELAGVTDIS